MLHDALAFLALLAVTVGLFAITLALFRSLQVHRADLAQRWAARGAAAYDAARPAEAVVDYRTALAYAPGDRNFELRLAESLGAAGHLEEAYTYFLGLWETRPGDGFINLQLGRLAGRRNDVQGSIDFYRAAIYGTWEGDGLTRRREVRLELARYLLSQHQPAPARAELLVAAGNAPNTPEIYATLATLLEQAGAPSDALNLERKMLAMQPRNLATLRAAGRLAFATGDYTNAHRYLERATRENPADPQTTALLAQTTRLLQLAPAENLPPAQRVDRILAARAIAGKRLATCAAGPSANSLNTRWLSPEGISSRTVLLHDADAQAAAIQLVYDTEVDTDHSCAPPSSDDALLLLLAGKARASEVSDR